MASEHCTHKISSIAFDNILVLSYTIVQKLLIEPYRKQLIKKILLKTLHEAKLLPLFHTEAPLYNKSRSPY